MQDATACDEVCGFIMCLALLLLLLQLLLARVVAHKVNLVSCSCLPNVLASSLLLLLLLLLPAPPRAEAGKIELDAYCPRVLLVTDRFFPFLLLLLPFPASPGLRQARLSWTVPLTPASRCPSPSPSWCGSRPSWWAVLSCTGTPSWTQRGAATQV
jgi:hypothetical protein